MCDATDMNLHMQHQTQSNHEPMCYLSPEVQQKAVRERPLPHERMPCELLGAEDSSPGEIVSWGMDSWAGENVSWGGCLLGKIVSWGDCLLGDCLLGASERLPPVGVSPGERSGTLGPRIRKGVLRQTYPKC